MFPDHHNKESMYKRKALQIHVTHLNPKRPRLHQFNDTDIADIAISIMVGIFARLPLTYTDDDIYDGIQPYIHDLKLELKYDDIPFDELYRLFRQMFWPRGEYLSYSKHSFRDFISINFVRISIEKDIRYDLRWKDFSRQVLCFLLSYYCKADCSYRRDQTFEGHLGIQRRK